MSSRKYVTQELFDERTTHISSELKDVKKEICEIKTKVDSLNSWKLKIIGAATLLSGLAICLMRLLK